MVDDNIIDLNDRRPEVISCQGCGENYFTLTAQITKKGRLVNVDVNGFTCKHCQRRLNV
jgi:predicted nucleic-acid-binding Zn-ribbon protein